MLIDPHSSEPKSFPGKKVYFLIENSLSSFVREILKPTKAHPGILNLDYMKEVIYVYNLNEDLQPEDGRRREFARI